jgi:hypothetical protein
LKNRVLNVRGISKMLNTEALKQEVAMPTTRPARGSLTPEACDNRYCYYDVLHKDYIYIPAWVEFLIEKLADAPTYAMVVGGTTPLVAAAVASGA